MILIPPCRCKTGFELAVCAKHKAKEWIRTCGSTPDMSAVQAAGIIIGLFRYRSHAGKNLALDCLEKGASAGRYVAYAVGKTEFVYTCH